MKNKPALIVIDFINDIVNQESPIAAHAAFVAEHHVIEHANHAITIARELQIPIIFVKLGFSKGYPECPNSPSIFTAAKENNKFQLGTWSTEYHPDLDFRENDISIVKHRVSAFYRTELDLILRTHDIDTVIIAGVSTAMTIDHTARDAHDRDYHVLVLADACGAATQELHDAALLVMNRICKIVNIQELKKELF